MVLASGAEFLPDPSLLSGRLEAVLAARLLVDDEHVARGSPKDLLVDAPLDETLEEAFLSRSDDDQIGAPLVGKTDDRLSWGTDDRDEINTHVPLADPTSCLLELPFRGLGRVGGIFRLDRCRYRRDDELRPD